MKDIMKWIAKVLFLAFACAVIGYTSMMTFNLATRLIPGNLILQLLVVVFFDGAGLVWFANFMFAAEGVAQWAISLLGWLLGIIGAFVMAGAELIFSQQVVVIPDPERYGWTIIFAVVAACLLHCFFAYLYHMVSPKNWQSINSAVQLAKMEQRAFSNALTETERQLDQVVGPLTETFLDMLTAGVQDKSAYFRRSFEKRQAQQVKAIDAQARDAGQPSPTPTTTKKRTGRGLFDLFNRSKAQPTAPAPTLPAVDMQKINDLLELLKAQQPAQQPSQDAGAPATQVFNSETQAPPFLAGSQPEQEQPK